MAATVLSVSDLWTLLQRRRREGAGAPVVTYVDADAGERTELSAVSLENAAAKIANALRDEYDLGPGATIGLRLPLHWQRSAWCAGAWTAGLPGRAGVRRRRSRRGDGSRGRSTGRHACGSWPS